MHDVDGIEAWEALRSTRSDPPAAATSTKDRRATYTFALEQAQQMFHAAASVGPATRPLQLFYGLSQAGRAIAAAAVAAGPDGWTLQGHGIGCIPGTLSGDLPDVKVYADKPGGRGSFVRLSQILTSPIWSKANPLSLNSIWDSLPENRWSPMRDDGSARRTPLYVEDRSMWPEPHPLVSVPVCYFPPWVIDSASRDDLVSYLRSFPGAADYDSYPRLGHADDAAPAFTRHDDGWGELVMHWMVDDGRNVTEPARLAHIRSRTQPYNESRYLFPAIGANTRPLHPIMAWWALLYTLSMLARYEPASWSRHIDVDISTFAVPLEALLNRALHVVPSLVLETINEVARTS